MLVHLGPAPVTEVTTTSIAQVSTGTSSVYVPTSPSTGTSASYEIRVSTSYPIPGASSNGDISTTTLAIVLNWYHTSVTNYYMALVPRRCPCIEPYMLPIDFI